MNSSEEKKCKYSHMKYSMDTCKIHVIYMIVLLKRVFIILRLGVKSVGEAHVLKLLINMYCILSITSVNASFM